MTPIEQVAWGDSLLEPRRERALERELRRDVGTLPPLVAYFESCPWLARAVAELNEFDIGPVEVDFALVDLIALVVSQDNSCRYCHASQRVLMRAQGTSERRIRRLEEDFAFAELDEPRRLALDFVRRVSRASPHPGEADRARLRDAGWSESAIREIALHAAANVFFNRVATIPAIPVTRVERISRHWLLGLVAPLSRRLIRSWQRRGVADALAPEQRSGPFAPLVCRLEGLPAAAKLRRAIDGAFDSPLLPRRAKALAFAVVARGLGCPHSEREAAALLVAEGMSSGAIDETLTHLGSSALDPLEARIVPFARETIRYEPIQVQRRAGELAESLETAPFVELVGVTALANALCRLWLALEAP